MSEQGVSLSDSLGNLQYGDYGIGVRGIDKGTLEEKTEIADASFANGIDILFNRKSVLASIISLGTNEYIPGLHQDIRDYRFGGGAKVNIIVAVPQYIQNRSGQRIFLGFPTRNKTTVAQQYADRCILDRVCGKMGKIPHQFVLGYLYENQDGSESFVYNNKHYSNLPLDDKEATFNEIAANMDETSKGYNDMINKGDIERLNDIKNKLVQINIPTYLVDNAISLVKKYKINDKTQGEIGDF